MPSLAALAVYDFTGRRVLVVLFNAFFGLPPVTVGLALCLLLSRSGPLGLFGLLRSSRAKARGVKLGRKPKLTEHQKREALRRRDIHGEPLREIARSYNVSHSTISRLTN
jgi:ABC-type tungstate transport system substrate-binding protein